jgi:hypothetical protein
MDYKHVWKHPKRSICIICFVNVFKIFTLIDAGLVYSFKNLKACVNFNMEQSLYKMPYLPPMAQNAKDILAIERNGVW